jgi:hypothetical protein
MDDGLRPRPTGGRPPSFGDPAVTVYSSAMDSEPGAGSVAEPVSAVVGRALEAYRALAEVGEQVTDEWQYVNDLVAVHSADLQALVTARPERRLPPAAVRAVELAIEEIGRIVDPHRAIDWLSTFPQIVRVAAAPPADAGRTSGAASPGGAG